MGLTDRLFDAMISHTRLAILVMLVLVAGVSAGAPMVESVADIDQFQSESEAGDKLDYVEANFTADGGTTVAQVVVRGENVLSRESLLETLRYQRQLRDSDVINRTLVEDDALSGVANAVAAALLRDDQARELQRRARELQRERQQLNESSAALQQERRQLNESFATLQRERQRLNESFAALQRERRQLNESFATLRRERQQLNATLALLEESLTRIAANPGVSIETQLQRVREVAPVTLDDEQSATFVAAARQLREAETEAAAEAAFERGTRGVLADDLAAVANRSERLEADAEALETRGTELESRAEELESRAEELESRAEELERRGAELRTRADELRTEAAALERERERLRTDPDLTLAEETAEIEAANATEVETAVRRVLSGDSGGTDSPLALMPTDYDVGSTGADATVLVVTQERELDTAVEGSAGPGIIDAQLEMRRLAESTGGDLRYSVLGSGIIAHEIDASMEDSLLIVAPLALLFVLVTLTVAYRDLLDILLGVFGIGAVLAMTFGFMGWTGIDFGQLFVAIPVLLIGLSIDYAIHIFMRHREQRAEHADLRTAMRVALTGVGIALVFVTATTATGFLSNVTSPVPPIREFGVVAAAGIVFALLVFCVLVPALKIELDELLEARGIDRHKRAFGTGGGRFSRALSVGAVAARRAPAVVLLLVLVATAAGIYGGLQVETSFEEEDFLAEDPSEWMTELPEPFTPERYTAKSTIDVVGDRFLGSNSNVELLIEGAVTRPETLQRLDATRREAAGLPITQSLADGEPVIDGPLSVMRSVARTNESFNETFTAADTTGDGVPDRNLEAVYDDLFAVAPERAGEHVHRTADGQYRALRLVVAVDGSASDDEVTDRTQALAAGLDGDGLTVTATGSIVLNTIVAGQLLDTVVQSLGITLVAVFLFLMVAYRITDGSATLGVVTLLPVAVAAAWIGGSMFLLGIPFNVITGMILSLTIGIGVAYSIHVSERYTLELERQGSVRAAMRAAVTGTGGALLGSAATTVGGFGVLVLAILPPLQQFGLITALSIVYAFVGSVLVLPTLLLLWTRIAGPQWARAQLVGDDDGAAASGATGGETSDETGSDVPVVDDAPSTDARNPADPAASGAASSDSPATTPAVAASRTLSDRHVRPGESVTVETRVTNATGRLVLRETVAGGSVTVESASPEPAQIAEQGGTVYVAWDRPRGTAVVYYAVEVPEAASHGATVEFEGAVLTADGMAPVADDDRVTVVTAPVERIRIDGPITAADLASARQYLAAGRITREQFERVYRAWLAGDSGREEGDGRGGSTRPDTGDE